MSLNDKDQAQLVQEWLEDCDEYNSRLPGITYIEESDEGVVIHLEDELRPNRFIEAIEGSEPLNAREDILHLDAEKVENHQAVFVYAVHDLGNGSLGKFKVGTTYPRGEEILLPGGENPMSPEEEPSANVVEDTLGHLIIYLNSINGV